MHLHAPHVNVDCTCAWASCPQLNFVLPRIGVGVESRCLTQIAQETLRHRQLELFRDQEGNPYAWEHPY